VIIVLALCATVGIVYQYKDKIIYLFIQEANKNLLTKVDVGKIDIDLFSTFPKFSIHFKNIKIDESVQGSKLKLAEVEHLYFTISFMELLSQNLKVNNLIVKNGKFHFKVFKDASNNFTIFKPNQEDVEKKASVFELQGIILDNVEISYADFQYKNQYHGVVKHALLNFLLDGEDWNISVDGKLLSKGIKVQDYTFLKDKELKLKSKLIHQAGTNLYTLQKTTLDVLNATFDVEGYYKYGKISYIDMKMSERNSDFQTIISFLPNQMINELAQYKSKGNVYFNAIIKGDVSRSRKPLIEVSFGSSDASFYHPELKAGFEHTTFNALFSNGGGLGKSKGLSQLYIKNFKSMLNSRALEGSLSYIDFNNPQLELNAKADVDMAYLSKIIPNEKLYDVKGDAFLNIYLKANIEQLKKNNYSNLITRGVLSIQDLNLKSKGSNIPLSHIYSTLRFDRENIDVEKLNIQLGKSDFYFKGKIVNVFDYFLNNKGILQLDGDLRANHIDIEQLLNASTSTDQYLFGFDPTLHIKTSFEAKDIRFKKFNPKNVKGSLKMSPQGWKLSDFAMQLVGGEFKLDGEILGNKDSTYRLHVNGKISNLPIDSMLYITDNFSQNFITYRHLKGKIYSDIDVYFNFDKNLNINLSSILSKNKVSIKNGMITQFGPLKALSKFINEESLNHIKFSDLENDISIANSTVFVPQMEIRSSIAPVQLMGYHKFDGR
jgi:hypothetical protein